MSNYELVEVSKDMYEEYAGLGQDELARQIVQGDIDLGQILSSESDQAEVQAAIDIILGLADQLNDIEEPEDDE